MNSKNLDCVAVEHFKEYLRIPSVQPDCDYSECVSFLQRMAGGLGDKGLPITVHEVAPGKPVVVVSWAGLRPELPSLLLSSHMDVVPVFPELWTHEPFSAEEDQEGNIYARGAQDMKCVGVQYLEAVHRLILQGFRPHRTVHICFTPDEEIGSHGMRMFVETEAFKKLNVGCVMDEGAASPDESFILDYGERTPYNVLVTCKGAPGHGSLLFDAKTAGEKLLIVLRRFIEKRSGEKNKLMNNPSLTVGDVTSINITMLNGGIQENVVPPELKVMFDCRLSIDTDPKEFEVWVESVCNEAGEGVEVDYVSKKERIEPTKLDIENIWWIKLEKLFDEMQIKVKPRICPATTDSRYIRRLGIPAFNFSPMNNTELKLHDHNEYLNKQVFLDGIAIYSKLIASLTNIQLT